MYKIKRGKAKKGTSENTFTTPFKSEYMSERWRGLLAIIDEAHLPKLGMPVDWKKTQEKHTQIAVNPMTNETINVATGVIIKHKEFPVGFIKSTPGSHSMPGTDQPVAIRWTRYIEPGKLSEHMVTDSHGFQQVPCIAHGDYVNVSSLAADHVQAQKAIKERQKALIEKLNDKSEPEFAEFLMKQDGMDKFFVQWGGKYYGTLFFYEIYLNDIDNIWLICDACNRYKKDQDTVRWFKKQWLYGPEFLDYLGKINDEGILLKAKDKKGLAQIAIEWFWTRHAHYISVAKTLFKDVTRPIQILNRHVDHVIGSGNQKRAERLQASLDAKLLILKRIAQAPFGMPRNSGESQHNSSDDELRLTPPTGADGKPIYPTVAQYAQAVSAFGEELPMVTRTGLKEKLVNIMQVDGLIDQPDEDKGADQEKDPKKPRIEGGLL
jgi:hypothetical protein